MNDLMRQNCRPFIFQIGANDGIGADPVRPFIIERNLPALLVEPLPALFALLRENYRGQDNVRFANCAVAEADGPISFFVADDDLLSSEPRLSGLSTLSRDQLLKELVRERIANPSSRIVETQAQGCTISTLIEQFSLGQVDVLQIDTEGFDWKVLSQFDLSFHKVRLINIEFFHLSREEREECLSHLTAQGFAMIQVLGDLVAYKQI